MSVARFIAVLLRRASAALGRDGAHSLRPSLVAVRAGTVAFRPDRSGRVRFVIVHGQRNLRRGTICTRP